MTDLFNKEEIQFFEEISKGSIKVFEYPQMVSNIKKK